MFANLLTLVTYSDYYPTWESAMIANGWFQATLLSNVGEVWRCSWNIQNSLQFIKTLSTMEFCCWQVEIPKWLFLPQIILSGLYLAIRAMSIWRFKISENLETPFRLQCKTQKVSQQKATFQLLVCLVFFRGDLVMFFSINHHPQIGGFHIQELRICMQTFACSCTSTSWWNPWMRRNWPSSACFWDNVAR